MVAHHHHRLLQGVILGLLVVLGIAALDVHYRRGPGLDVLDFGAIADGATDNCTHFTDATTALAANGGGTLVFPPGDYLTSCPILLQGGAIYQGAGDAATRILTPASGTGFPVFANQSPGACAGGTGDATSCDDAINGGTRGPGCRCYTGADCQSGTCTVGTVQRRLVVRDLSVRLDVDNTIGFDLYGIAQSELHNVRVVSNVASATNTIGIWLSDGNGSAAAGYDNFIVKAWLGGSGDSKHLTTGVRLQPQANDGLRARSRHGDVHDHHDDDDHVMRCPWDRPRRRNGGARAMG